MTLYDKIREAVFREPRITRVVAPGIEVFNTDGEKAAEAKEAVVPNVQAAQDGLGKSMEGEGARQAPIGGAHHARYGGGLNVARAGTQDGERINSLTTQVAAIQAVVAKDPQQALDLAHFARFANDAIRVHSGLVK